MCPLAPPLFSLVESLLLGLHANEVVQTRVRIRRLTSYRSFEHFRARFLLLISVL